MLDQWFLPTSYSRNAELLRVILNAAVLIPITVQSYWCTKHLRYLNTCAVTWGKLGNRLGQTDTTEDELFSGALYGQTPIASKHLDVWSGNI